MNKRLLTRRGALRVLGTLSAGSSLRAEEPAGRITPLGELVNTLEFESMAQRKLTAAVFATIAGSNREDMERYTFRPVPMVDTTKLNLTIELFGQSMFAPILVGPAGDQMKIHSQGELAMVRGASAAKAVTVISGGAGHAMEKIVAEANGPIWFQVFADAPELERAQAAVKLGCKVIVITVRNPQKPDWPAIDQVRKGITVPVVLKGVITPADARNAVKRGVQGIVVSNYGAQAAPSSFAMLPSIADAVGGKIPVLVDGGFRRGTDILKALILGAQAVLVTRPPLWGLAAYGADGVQAVLEILQTELARNMIMIGAETPKALNRSMIKFH